MGTKSTSNDIPLIVRGSNYRLRERGYRRRGVDFCPRSEPRRGFDLVPWIVPFALHRSPSYKVLFAPKNEVHLGAHDSIRTNRIAQSRRARLTLGHCETTQVRNPATRYFTSRQNILDPQVRSSPSRITMHEQSLVLHTVICLTMLIAHCGLVTN